MSTKEFVEKLAAYMKANRSLTMKQKCKIFDITPRIYYGLCKKHGVDGRKKKKIECTYSR